MDRTCQSCGKVFKYPSGLKRHASRRTPCNKIVPPALTKDEAQKCKYCNRAFAQREGRVRHETTSCPARPKNNETVGPNDIIAEQSLQIQELREQMQQLLTERAPPQQAIQANGDHATVNQIQHQEIKQENHISNAIRNEITVKVFGQEKVDHITAPQIYHLLMNAKGAADPGVQALLDTALVVFSDPAKPENLTCYLPNKKTSDALVHEASPTGETSWQIKPIETVLSPMVQRSLDVLFRKQPYGHEPGLPNQPDIVSCGEVLKQVAALESDPSLAKKTTAPHGPLRTVLVRNKDVLARANGGTPPMAGEE